MEKISCNIIKDILPLYVDDVVSDDTKALILEHIETCAKCKAEYDKINEIVYIPRETDTGFLKHLNKQMTRNKIVTIFVTAFLTLTIVLLGYFSFHFFRTIDGGDTVRLEAQAINYLRDTRYFSELPEVSRHITILKTEIRGDYMAALCSDDGGMYHLCVFERDSVFRNRWRANGGSSAASSGEISSWNVGIQGDAILVFFGAELPDNAEKYTFENGGITYLCTIENNIVLDLFVIMDSYDINAIPELIFSSD